MLIEKPSLDIKLVDNGTSVPYKGGNINLDELDYKFTDTLFCPPEFNSKRVFSEKS